MDCIEVKGIEIYAYHGVYEEEKQTGQPFEIDLSMQCVLEPAGRQDDLTLSSHYGEITRVVVETATGQSYDLIEAVAYRCARAVLLGFPGVRTITVTVHKPKAPIPYPFADVNVSVTLGWHRVYLSYGSNLGDRKQFIENALEAIRANDHFRALRCSRLYETEPYGGVEQENFLNGACFVETIDTPRELLDYLHTLEQEAGRERLIHWGPRTLDLDILFYDDLVLETTDLVIPHPDMQNRRFVLEPLSELTRYYEHPVLHCPIAALLASLNTVTEVEP